MYDAELNLDKPSYWSISLLFQHCIYHGFVQLSIQGDNFAHRLHFLDSKMRFKHLFALYLQNFLDSKMGVPSQVCLICNCQSRFGQAGEYQNQSLRSKWSPWPVQRKLEHHSMGYGARLDEGGYVCVESG